MRISSLPLESQVCLESPKSRTYRLFWHTKDCEGRILRFLYGNPQTLPGCRARTGQSPHGFFGRTPLPEPQDRLRVCGDRSQAGDSTPRLRLIPGSNCRAAGMGNPIMGSWCCRVYIFTASWSILIRMKRWQAALWAWHTKGT